MRSLLPSLPQQVHRHSRHPVDPNGNLRGLSALRPFLPYPRLDDFKKTGKTL